MAHRKHETQQDVYESVENAAKTLLANIRFASVDNPIRSIAITSSIPNEGKTFVSSNLANAIATSGKTVLLVETDMRGRSLSGMLGVHPEHGLYSVISGQVPLTMAAVQTPTPRMFFLDAEPHIPNPSDLINSRHFSQLIGEMMRTFDYVIFDTPPVGTFVDAAVLGSKVDATLLVVRENFTKSDEVVRAVDQLSKANANLIGVIMNFCERQSSEYYYEYYYRNRSRGRGRRRRKGKDEPAVQPAAVTPEMQEVKTPGTWDNSIHFEDTSSQRNAESQGQQTFRNEGTALSQAVVDLHGQVNNAQQARQMRVDTSTPEANAQAQAPLPVTTATASSRPNDDMSRYHRRQR